MVSPFFSLLFSSDERALMQVSMTTQSDESSESLALYTLAQIGVQSLWVGNLHGGTPYPPRFLRQKKTVNEINFSFIFFLLFLQRLDENVLSETSGWFIDPLEELAVTLLTLEVETSWVLLGT